MRIKPYSIAFLTAAILCMAQTSYASERSADLNNMLQSLSNLLSSTNPKPAYKNLEPSSGGAIDTPEPDRKARIAGLPPLSPPVSIHAGTSQLITPEPEAMPRPKIIAPVAEIAAPKVDYAKLSPETRRILESTPSRIGGMPQQKAEHLSMKRGDFDPEYGKLIDGPIDKAEKPEDAVRDNKLPKLTGGPETLPGAEQPKKKYEIDMQNARSSNGSMEVLGKALRALNAGQYEVSVALYKSVLQKDSRNRDALFGLATSYQKAGQKNQARDSYARLLQAYPTYQPGLNNMLVLASSEAPQDALKELEAISARSPNFAPIYAQKGAIYAQGGDNENARKNFIKALSIEPDNILYRYNLAVFLDKSGDVKGAARLYSQILDLNTKGKALPVERRQIEDRLVFIGSQKAARS